MPVTINIVNLEKTGSQYNDGMLPCFYSQVRSETQNVGWERASCDTCCYYASECGDEKRGNGLPYYVLTFTLEFPYENDTVYLAMSVPYTQRDLDRDIGALPWTDPLIGPMLKRETLCKTVGGVDVDLLTIADKEAPIPLEERQVAVITARVHPGEANASWMMRGVMQFLVGNSEAAKTLRRSFVIKLVPMLNPDGVMIGNYRCSMAGLDLNRQYRSPSRRITPSVYYLKKMIKSFSIGAKHTRVAFMCDLHGHSRKFDSFIYGCRSKGGRATLSISKGLS